MRWFRGLYPGCGPGECTDGTAPTFDQARADFEAAWRVFLAKRTETDFQAWRDQRDWTEQKYAMWKRGDRMPTQKPNSVTRSCGQLFDTYRPGAPPSTSRNQRGLAVQKWRTVKPGARRGPGSR